MIDLDLNDHKNIMYSSIIRFFLSLAILFLLPIPIFVRLLIISFLDVIDCSGKKKKNGESTFNSILGKYNDPKFCLRNTYQTIDKINDQFISFFILLFILKFTSINNNWKLFIIFLFIYRLIGLFLFFATKNTKLLIFFPNFFLEFTILYFFIDYFPILKPYQLYFYFILFILKCFQEYEIHVNGFRNWTKIKKKLKPEFLK